MVKKRKSELPGFSSAHTIADRRWVLLGDDVASWRSTCKRILGKSWGPWTERGNENTKTVIHCPHPTTQTQIKTANSAFAATPPSDYPDDE